MFDTGDVTMSAARCEQATSLEALESELVGLAGHLAAAHHRWLRLLAEFDARDGWAGPGLRSCAHWLSWRVGMSVRTGFEQVRVAHALSGLPEISAAFAAGRISYSKVRAITRVATADTERPLLDLSLAGTASHVERVVRAIRQSQARPAAVEARRRLDWEWDHDGSLVLRGRFTAEQGASLLAAIEHATSPPERSAERGVDPADVSAPPEVLGARRADALIALVTGAAKPVAELMVVVEADSIEVAPDPSAGSADGRADAEQRPAARLRGGPALPRSTAERLGCTARVRAMVRDRRGNPLFLGRGRRLASRAQLTALHVRDRGCCRFPGCTQTRHLDAHHIVPWMRGGRTDLDNLLLFCGRHHRLVHDHGYRITGSGADVEFHRPDGRPIPAAGPPLSGCADELLERYSDPTITDQTIVPTWAGERLDLSAALDCLLPVREWARAA